MQNDSLATLARLSDNDLAARVKSLAARESEAMAPMVAHLAEMDTREIHLRDGYPRLYDYCRAVLHLSEWEAWNRIEAGRLARRFPILLDMLEDGSINTTGIKLLGPQRTPENHRVVLREGPFQDQAGDLRDRGPPRSPARRAHDDHPDSGVRGRSAAARRSGADRRPPTRLAPQAPQRLSRSLPPPLFHRRRSLPCSRRSLDDDAILNRALGVLIDKLAREKFAQTDKPRPDRPRSRRARRPSAAVSRVIRKRDGGRCKYVSPDAHRCEGKVCESPAPYVARSFSREL